MSEQGFWIEDLFVGYVICFASDHVRCDIWRDQQASHSMNETVRLTGFLEGDSASGLRIRQKLS